MSAESGFDAGPGHIIDGAPLWTVPQLVYLPGCSGMDGGCVNRKRQAPSLFCKCLLPCWCQLLCLWPGVTSSTCTHRACFNKCWHTA